MEATTAKKILGLTMGDPAGIGPELIAQYLISQEAKTHESVVYGRRSVLQRALELFGVERKIKTIQKPSEIETSMDSIWVRECGDARADEVAPGEFVTAGGKLALEALRHATQHAMSGELSAIVTGPLHKKALNAAGVDEPGHTELLGRFCGVKEVAMMLHLPESESVAGPIGLSVVHVTLHNALRQVFDLMTFDSIVAKIQLANDFCKKLLAAKTIDRLPRIGVAALNPHGGEQGLFGKEEIEIIRPAVQACQVQGIDAIGPEPCDTLMRRAALGEFDAVVAMYHDQGHIALKLLDMFETVNVTLGLPIIRTSVAHGTAEEIAWQGKADTRSFHQAAKVALEMACD